MKLIRFSDRQGAVHHGSQLDSSSALLIEGELYGSYVVTDKVVEVAKLLAPVVPHQIICIGLNYRKHAEEMKAKFPDFPVVFYKNVSAAQNPEDPILIPTYLPSHEVDYECELAVVIGKKCKNVSRAEALRYVLGYSCANDVSARDWQVKKSGGQWCRGKSFDTFCPLGPCLVTTDELVDPNDLRIQTKVNGQLVQDSHTSDMIFNVPSLIEFLSGSTTLEAGTVILTGTPSGVGMAASPQRWLQAGDRVSIEIEGIGQLNNPVSTEMEKAV